MRAPALMLIWEVWAQQRVLFTLGLLHLLVLCVLGPLVPPNVVPLQARCILLIPLAVVSGLLVAACGQGFQGRLESASSSYPVRLLTMPVTSLTLASCPFLLATTSVALGWLLCAVFILQPAEENIPVVWPALLGANVAGWLLFNSWSPFPLPWLRVFVAMFGLLGFFFAAIIQGERAFPAAVVIPALLALLLRNYLLTVRAVVLARQGTWIEADGVRWWEWLGSGKRPNRSFSSSLGAQIWLEWRMQGRPFLWAHFFCLLFFLPSMFLARYTVRLKVLLEVFPAVKQVVELLGPDWLILGQLSLIPLLLAMFGGADVGRFTLGQPGYRFADFLAVRPISTGFLIRSKLVSNALITLISWALVLGVGLIWAVSFGEVGELASRLAAVMGSGARAALLVVWMLATLAVFSWSQLVAQIWIAATGRAWVVSVWLLLYLGLLGCGGFLVATILNHPPLQAPARALLPWGVGALVGLKVLAMVGVGAILLHRRVPLRDLGKILLVWFLAVLATTGLLLWLIPPEVVAPPLLIAGVVLAFPLARCGLAPLAVEWNRHR